MAFSFEHRYDRDILGLALPALGELAVDPLVSLVDTAFVGQLGSTQLGALGVNASIFSMAFVAFNFLAYGTTPRVSRAVGNDNPQKAGRIVMHSIVLAVVVGVGALALLQWLAGPILALMGATGDLREPAMTYLRIRACAGPAVLLMNAGRGSFRGYSDTRTPMYVMGGINLVNLILDPILIFGLGFGLAGAATARVIAQWSGAIAFLVLLLYVRRDELEIPLVLPSIQELVPFLKVGRELFIRTVSLIGTMTLATAVAARVGVTAVAAHQVANQLWTFLALVVDALAIAAQTLVARQIGEGEPDEARAVSDRLLQWGIGIGVLLGVAFFAARPWLPGLFVDDPETIGPLLDVFIFVALLQPLNGLVFVWDGVYMGAESFGYLAGAMVISALCAAGVLLLVEPMEWGLPGVWWGITTLMVVRVITLAIPYFVWDGFLPGAEAS